MICISSHKDEHAGKVGDFHINFMGKRQNSFLRASSRHPGAYLRSKYGHVKLRLISKNVHKNLITTD